MSFTTPERIALRDASPDTNYGSPCRVRSFVQLAALSGRCDERWTGAVRKLAQQARAAGATRIVVLGGAGLVGNLESEGAETVVVDQPWRAATRKFLGNPMSEAFDFDALETALPARDGDAYVVVDLLERVRDPRPLLAFLKRRLLAHPGFGVGILSGNRAPGNSPPSVDHHREWSPRELSLFLSAAGFTFEAQDASGGFIQTQVSLTRETYSAFLDRHHLPSLALQRLILTTEHGRCRVTGGIGAYVEERAALSGPALGVSVLQGSEHQLPSREVQQALRWLQPELLGLTLEGRPLTERAARLLAQALLYFPDLQVVEYQDYLGLGGRLWQFRAAGLLPAHLRFEVVCHGATPYLERSNQKWLDFADLEQAHEERLSILHADRAVFPTHFLSSLYEETGYLPSPEKIVHQRLPFSGFDQRPALETITEADTLVFFGKRSRMKGFPLFVAALRLLLTGPAREKLKRVVVIGPVVPGLDAENADLRALASEVEVVELDLPRTEALLMLERLAATSVVAMPYTADNHPVSILEVASRGCQLVATRQGGIPELLPATLHDQTLAIPRPEDLSDLLGEALSLDGEERRRRVTALFDQMRVEQVRINASVRESDVFPANAAAAARASGKATVIVPCFNTDLRLVQELLRTLNEQTLAPAKVLFIDDGSEPTYAERLQRVVKAELRHPFTILRHAVNRGLPASRNTALAEVETEYLVNVDSDDILKNDFLRLYVEALDRHPEAAAASSYIDFFSDGHPWEFADALGADGFRPLGAGLLLAQSNNAFGHANSAFRTAAVRRVNGWDAHDSSMWEDLALFEKLTTRGEQLVMVPRGTAGYRYRPDSMARVYSRFGGQWRVARNNLALPPFEAFRLQSVFRSVETLQEENEALRQRVHQLQAYEHEFHRLRSRISRKLMGGLEGRPEIYHSVRRSVDEVIVAARRLKESAGHAVHGVTGNRLRANGHGPGISGLLNSAIGAVPGVQRLLKPSNGSES